jgi:hypothetical protein
MSNIIRLRWVAIGLLLAAIITIVFFLPKPSAEQASEAGPQPLDGACSEANPGVTLIVDFGQSSNRQPVEKCVDVFTGTGWELFKAANVAVEGTAKYPEFACRIEGFPSADHQDCGETASFDKGYWSYFYADAVKAQSWTMSPVGAADRNPGCGEVEGWVYVAADNASATPAPKAQPFVCSVD